MSSCNCSTTTLSCCPEKIFVQDQVCTPWQAVGDATAVTIPLFQNNINQNIIGTGFVKYEVGSATLPIQIVFLNSAGGTINTETVTLGSSLAFTIRRFDVIQAIIPIGADILFQGEFCITTRYSV
ncbi:MULTISPECIES: DUF3992 domain-containing protein [unclassified Bacillus (in: firmicutes)]|uniref:DUF3992 domain-containing protein n=1 Tax=unclassified Bacillus (in: firmicutes) TaxID=185979 RepID=UPI000BEFB864|nr:MULTISPECIES: S-Ena type endospore appendage [unclassified Bacillus (in: firmicutes)]PEJ59903.1 hypothetical protein CN692_03745 [Bacillus sp. AFS002410]PEL06747.1 hypothetical protein CN601_20690 [Bacillus sp. AFS017336]